jgi:hypothetical protein
MLWYCHMSGVPWLITGSGVDDWIYWHLHLQSPLITITTGHNRWLPKTHSIPYWTTSVFSFIVTDFVLIYESVTSTNDFSFKHESWRVTQSITCLPSITSGRTEYRLQSPTVHVIVCLPVAAETCVNSITTLWFLQAYPLSRKLA